MIFLCTLTMLLIGQSSGQHCENNQTNYTSYYYREFTKEVKTTSTVITSIEDDCGLFKEIWTSFWGLNKCGTLYIYKVITTTKNLPTSETYSVTECCPGYSNVSNECEKGCSEHKYGVNCTLNCSCPSFCDSVTGDCICEPGYNGTNCSEACPVDFYGRNCKHTCMCKNNSTCNPKDGSCNCTSPGWQGEMCDKECANDTFGLFCNLTCTCNENQTCDPVDGSCTCKPGWMGENCTEECDEMKFGVNCSNKCTCDTVGTQKCDRETGFCHCNDGYTNSNCSQECQYGYFGKDCSGNCSEDCNNTDYCDHINGSCICLGTHGSNCDQVCDAGTYGPNCAWPCNCSNSVNETCQNMTGQCLCSPGWTGKICNEECPDGSYGPNCNNNCSDVCNGTETCDPNNGTCICSHRFGANCSAECLPDYYGIHCENECHCNHSNSTGSCDRNGTCLCKEGWTTCETVVDNNTGTTSGTKSGSGSSIGQNTVYFIVGPIAVMVLVIVLVVFLRRSTIHKRLKAKHNSHDSYVQNNPSYDTSFKDTIPLSNSSSDTKPNKYVVLDVETNTDLNGKHSSDANKVIGDGEHNHLIKNSVAVGSNTKPDNIEDEYSMPDKDMDVEKETKPFKQEKGKTEQNEDEYDITANNVVAKENEQHEYNTFQDVVKIQKEAKRKESETDEEEDYDVLAHTASQKKKHKDAENYSSFEQVRKLMRQESIEEDEEEDTYNALNEHLHGHKSAHVEASSYHHISIKDKTIDGHNFAIVPPSVKLSTQRQISAGNKPTKQNDTIVINEDSEEEEANSDMEVDLENPRTSELLEEEVIYDECDIDDVVEESNSKKNDIHAGTVDKVDSKDANITEIVYEECDEFVEDKPRPQSPVVYEDVADDDENEEDNDDTEEEEDEEEEVVKETQKPNVKRTAERRKHDYEEFNF